MRDYEANSQSRRDDTLQDRFSRFTGWLSRRPIESWGFFIAGVIVARILF